MAMIGYAAVVGIFEDRLQAERAVDELKAAGFRDDQIGYLLRERPVLRDIGLAGQLFAWLGQRCGLPLAGAIVGGLAGGLFTLSVVFVLSVVGLQVGGDTAMALAGGVLLGALGGGFLGGLGKNETLGRGSQQAEQEPSGERTVIMVRTQERQLEAASILRKYGARDALVPRATETAAMAALRLPEGRELSAARVATSSGAALPESVSSEGPEPQAD
jgi:hypothetical protein